VNTEHPKVSVIIPSFMRPDYLNQALESVGRQTFTDYEIIVIDDCSGPEIVSQYRLLAGARLICHETRGGTGGSGRNTGARAARGEYLAFLDMDDVWLPHKLAKQVKILDEYPEFGLTYCHCIYVDDELVPLEPQLKPYVSPANDTLRQLLITGIIKSPSAVLLRKDVFEAVGGFDTNLIVNDRDLWMRVALQHRLHGDPQPGFLYRRHPNQMSRNHRSMLYSYAQLMEKTLTWVPKARPDLSRMLRGIAGRTLRDAAWEKLQEGASCEEVLRLVRISRQVWPWAPWTYLLALKVLRTSRDTSSKDAQNSDCNS
jgi:glycosyltransferase involved in cell wall biosynthesis